MNAAATLKRAAKIEAAEAFKVGDFVHRRTWSYQFGKQVPVVEKRPMKIVAIDGRGIVCGGNRCFDAFELVKSDWKPSFGNY